MYKKDIQSCCFVCSSVKKSVAAENERHTFWTRDTFSYARRKRRIQFVQCTNTTTNHFITHSQFQVLPSLTVLLSEVGPATAAIGSVHDCTSCHCQVKRRHVIGQTLRCLREIRTWVQHLSCVACVACVTLRCLRNSYARSCVAYVTCVACVV